MLLCLNFTIIIKSTNFHAPDSRALTLKHIFLGMDFNEGSNEINQNGGGETADVSSEYTITHTFQPLHNIKSHPYQMCCPVFKFSFRDWKFQSLLVYLVHCC